MVKKKIHSIILIGWHIIGVTYDRLEDIKRKIFKSIS